MIRVTDQDKRAKFQALADMVRAIKPVYDDALPSGQALIETTVGAAIFYLPTDKKRLWSGMISESLKNVNRSKWCADHMYPRKISARRLLYQDWSEIEDPAAWLENLYYAELGRYHYVTKSENNQLKVAQKAANFVSPEQAYRDCGIQLIELVPANLVKTAG